MEGIQYVLGCDISNLTLVCSVLNLNKDVILTPKEFANNAEGFTDCLAWLKKANVSTEELLVCMEHTGVYSESFCYFLFHHHIPVTLESGAKIKKSFKLVHHKTDSIDSLGIGEYAIRYADRLSYWKPRHSSVEKMKSLLSTRELLIKHRTALKNARLAYTKKIVQDDVIKGVFEKEISGLNTSIADMEQEMAAIINENEQWASMVALIKTAPGAADKLAYHLFILSDAFSQRLNYKKLSAYLRICPYQYQSGTSIKKRARSPKYSPRQLKDLLHLASRSVMTYNPAFKQYYLRKKEEGKPGWLILNNIANKLIRLLCAMVNAGVPYVPNYRSVNPILLK
jgi:transposase